MVNVSGPHTTVSRTKGSRDPFDDNDSKTWDYHVLKHRAGVENKATNALTQKIDLLYFMHVKVIGFERLKEEYQTCPDFRDIYTSLKSELQVSIHDYI